MLAQFGDWNLVISIFAFLLGAAQLVFLYRGTLIGTWGTFIPMHWIGMQGMPRRVADYSASWA